MKQPLLLGVVFFLTSFLYAQKAKSPNNFTKEVFGQTGSDTLKAQILTPPAPASPRINGAKVFGVRPGSPFLFYIPATGIRPIVFSAKGLPNGLSLDANTGMITGSVAKAGTYHVMLKAKNAKGAATRNLKVVVGDTIALTPPMGWNSWNVFAANVSADKVKKATDAMVNSGLINHGWTYINIDDYWQNKFPKINDQTFQEDYRDAQGNILSNARFPNMKGLADYIHSKGLKAGLYSSPGPYTCGGRAGSWRHELQDAKTYADWGFDFLKYDWCSYGRIVTDSINSGIPIYKNRRFDSVAAVYPYDLMGKAIKAQKRDIVYSLCQYGVGDVWKWGAKVNGSCWRTTGDIFDSWELPGKSNAQNSVSKIGFNQDQSAPYSGPGRYNDPDMLVIGYVGWGKPHPTRLTPDEQYAHISLWCLLSAPLLLGCDLEKLDDFTLNLITNDEVIDIDQDPLAIGARRVSAVDSLEIFKKPLEDGSVAVGLFNRRSTKANIKVNWSDLGITGKQIIRDVWRQKDIVIAKDNYEAEVAAHGVLLLRLKRKK